MNVKCIQDYTLKIKIIDETMRDYYKSITLADILVDANNINAGYDIYLTKDIILEPNKNTYIEINSGIQCEMVAKSVNIIITDNIINTTIQDINTAYLLMPRSSISKYNIIMSNSIGLIDSTYRGEILARIYNLNDKVIEFKNGDRLFQLVAPNLAAFNVELVDTLNVTERNDSNFGSTGR